MALEATVIAAIRHLYIYGASKQNRTVIICLEGRGFAIKLYLHMRTIKYLSAKINNGDNFQPRVTIQSLWLYTTFAELGLKHKTDALAGSIGFEPMTHRLTADCATATPTPHM